MPKTRSKPPELGDCQVAADADVRMWSMRDSRFHTEQDLVFLIQAGTKKPDEEIVTPTDPAFLSEKMARIISRLGHTREIRIPNPEMASASQLLTNYCTQLYRDWSTEFTRALLPPLSYSIGRYYSQRGWLCARLMACSESEEDCTLPVHLTLWDPATIYPYRTGNKITRITHRYRAKVDDLRADDHLPDVEDTLALMAADQLMWVYSQYWQYKGTWYHMVWSQGAAKASDKDGWLKKPMAIGYNPWIISIPVGVPWSETAWDQTDYKAHIGESFITGMVPMLDQLQKTMSIQATALVSTVNPSLAFVSKDAGVLVPVDKLSVKPGARMSLPPGELKTIRVGPELQEIIAYISLIEDKLRKQGFQDAQFGDPQGLRSGYMGDVLRMGNADITYPYSAALETFWTQVYEQALWLTGKFWSEPIEVYVKHSFNRKEGFYKMPPQDILKSKPQVSVHIGELSLQEKLQMMSLLSMAVRENILSLDTARGHDWLTLEDPEFEGQKVLADMVFKDPDMVKTLIPLSLMWLGKDAENTLYGKLHGSEIAQRLMQGMGQMMQGGQGPGVPPEVPPGVPGEALSPVAATGVPQGAMNPGLLQVMERLRALMGAQGGAGAGGVPPMPGMPMERVPNL